ncbi:MAG: amino acid adenylation domain-containing protein, partial [Bacteroidota bacterium]
MKITGSYHQQRLWFIDFFEKDYLYDGSPVYHNIPLYVPLEVTLTEESLHQILLKLMGRHEVLRTQLVQKDGQVFQVIPVLSAMDLDSICTEEKGLFEKLTILREKPLDFKSLFHVYFEQTKTGTHLFFLFHHAIMDRYSIRKVKEELEKFLKQPNEILEDAANFKDFSNWQNALTKDDLEPLLFYWKSKLKNLQVLYFTTDMERKQVHKYESQNVSFTFSKAEIASFCKGNNWSPQVLFLTAFKMALARLTGLTDIVVGTFFDLRNLEGKTLLGPVENLVVLRSLLHMEDTLWETHRIVQEVWEEAETYKTMPFDRLVNVLNPKKDMSRTALFDILYTYEITNNSNDDGINWNEGWGKYDFNLLVNEHLEAYEIILNYNGLYFYKETAQSLLDLIRRFVEITMQNSDQKLGEIELITSEEKERLVPPVHIPTQKEGATLVSLFAEQVDLHGERIGIQSEERSLTYREIDQKSNQLAHVLLEEYQLQLEDKVAVVLSNPEQIVITLWALLKLGVAYVPIHPNYPKTRQKFMMEDFGCSIRIDDQLLQKLSAQIETANTILPKRKIKPQNLAYIIYTSGTTGQPKGVLIEHGNVVQLLRSCYREMSFSEVDGWLFFHSYCFDFSVWEIFGCLLSGGRLAVMMGDEARNPEALAVLMNTFKTTVFNQTPSAFYNFIDLELEVPSLRYVIFGGETLNPLRLKSWSDQYPEVSLINMYGITETTVHVTFKALDAKDFSTTQSNIGKPLSFAQCYVLDGQKKLLPFGRPGELYVAGAGVARGYLNRPELTAERFLENPFQPNGKMYRTGDLVRYLEGGEMEYLGRVDDQVKIRGYRIELDEIKRQLETLSGVSQCVVTTFEAQDGDKSIVAYVVVGHTLTVAEIKSYIATKVPEYMVPAFIVLLDGIPMNSNGKIDKTNLPSPLGSVSQNSLEIIEPSNSEEITLFEIWKELLHVEAFGITHNFFDLGGHSLKATRLIAAIQKNFGVKIKLRDIFENPSIQDQVLLISRSEKESYAPIEKVATMESYLVSNGQHRLWSASKIEGGSAAFNMPSWLLLDGDYDLDSFRRAIGAVIARHEILRTVFRADDRGEVRQWVLSSDVLDFSIDYQDFTSVAHPREQADAYMADDA